MRKTADSRRRAGTELAKQGGTISSTPILLARLMEAHCFSRSVRLKQEAALSEKIADAVRSGHTNYQRSQGGVWEWGGGGLSSLFSFYFSNRLEVVSPTCI